MGEHVAAVMSSGGYQVPPHAVVIANGAMQTTSANQNTQTSPSYLVPAAVLAGTVGSVAVAAYAIDRFCRVVKTQAQSNDRCYKDAAEAMASEQITYSPQELEATLHEICVKKFRDEGSVKRNGPRRFFFSEDALQAAAKDSVAKSLRNGLSANKLTRLLTHQATTLAAKALLIPTERRVEYADEFLRPFSAYHTARSDIAEIPSEQLFPREDVKRFVLLYMQTIQKSQSSRAKEVGHYVTFENRDGDWHVHDAKNQYYLAQGVATRASAKKAIVEFAKRKYDTTKFVNLTIIRQEPRFVMPAR